LAYEGASVEAFHAARRFTGAGLVGVEGDRDIGAFHGEGFRDGAPDTGVRPGDDREAASELVDPPWNGSIFGFLGDVFGHGNLRDVDPA
jgi:hypothetical protein